MIANDEDDERTMTATTIKLQQNYVSLKRYNYYIMRIFN